jgi:hypothetical protein
MTNMYHLNKQTINSVDTLATVVLAYCTLDPHDRAMIVHNAVFPLPAQCESDCVTKSDNS